MQCAGRTHPDFMQCTAIKIVYPSYIFGAATISPGLTRWFHHQQHLTRCVLWLLRVELAVVSSSATSHQMRCLAILLVSLGQCRTVWCATEFIWLASEKSTCRAGRGNPSDCMLYIYIWVYKYMICRSLFWTDGIWPTKLFSKHVGNIIVLVSCTLYTIPMVQNEK